MAERELVVPRAPVVDPQTGQLSLPWQDFFTLLVKKIRALENP